MPTTFVILAVTILLFVWGRYPVELVALVSLLALVLTGVLDVGQAMAGFGDSTVVMIAALFVVGEGLSRTGVTGWLGEKLLTWAGGSENRLLILLMLGAATLSAFISNTGTVATLLPAVVAASWRIGSTPSRFLIPLSFAASTGGLLTLTGSPPNIIVADVLTDGGHRTFNYFEFALIGLPLLLLATVFMVWIGKRLLPTRGSERRPIDVEASIDELTEAYAIDQEVCRLRVRRGSALIGRTLREAGLGSDFGLLVVHVERAGKPAKDSLPAPLSVLSKDQDGTALGPETRLFEGDLVDAIGTQKAVQNAMAHFRLGLVPAAEGGTDDQQRWVSSEVGIAEVLITPRSAYIGKTVRQGQIAQKYDVQVLSIRRRDRPVPLTEARLQFGDSLLVRGTWESIGLLATERRNFVVVGSPEEMARESVGLKPEAGIAVAALIGMVVLMVGGWVHTVVAALLAALAMTLGGCLTPREAYRSVSWESVILIAAMIPMSTALRVTGGVELLADGLVGSLGQIHPLLLMAGVFVLTAGFSQVISNTATTVLVSPIVLKAALDLGLSPQPMLMAVAVSASTAFLTPIGTTTNLLVLSPGGYRFGDYWRTGLPLLLLFLVASLLLIPLIWPL
jgi:di/tricarboxylate transporter